MTAEGFIDWGWRPTTVEGHQLLDLCGVLRRMWGDDRRESCLASLPTLAEALEAAGFIEEARYAAEVPWELSSYRALAARCVCDYPYPGMRQLAYWNRDRVFWFVPGEVQLLNGTYKQHYITLYPCPMMGEGRVQACSTPYLLSCFLLTDW